MAASVAAALAREPGYVYIQVKLSREELRSVRRILDGKFEPLSEAWLVVKVQKGEKR